METGGGSRVVTRRPTEGDEFSATKRAKVGKRVEKGIKEKASTSVDEEGAKSAEDYQCTGNLEQDFTELCSRMGILEIPLVVARAQRSMTPVMPVLLDEIDSVATSDKSHTSSTIPTKDYFSFFRPNIQVDTENDDLRMIRGVYIRGWLIDGKFMSAFQKSLPAVSNLQSINLWHVGLTDSTFTTLVSIISQCTNIRTVVVDGNPIPQQPYHKLLGEDSQIQNLTLRHNKLDDDCARLIGQSLSHLKYSNKNLLSLNLGFNFITDKGAGYIADGLRLNRSLVSLSLAFNRIGNEGAIKLAEVLGPFPLTHKEVVERRHLLLEGQDRQKSPSVSRRPDMKSERSMSFQGSITGIDKIEKQMKTSKVASKKKDKESTKKDEKLGSISLGLGTTLNHSTAGKREEGRLGKRPSIGGDAKISKLKGAKTGTKEKRMQLQEEEATEFVSPLVEPADHRDSKLYLHGNFYLMNLVLTGNKITETGLKVFLKLIETQSLSGKQSPDSKSTCGLLRLSLLKNDFPINCETYIKIHEKMSSKDPMSKPRVLCSPMVTANSDQPDQS